MLTPYQFASNSPIANIDLDGLEALYVAGAGGDAIGWDYINRFKRIFTEEGITDFEPLEEAHRSWKWPQQAGAPPVDDILFTANHRNTPITPHQLATDVDNTLLNVKAGVERVKVASTNLPDGDQLNLIGYSFGSVYVAQVAQLAAEEGVTIDNLVLIGSPTSDDSELMDVLNKLQEAGSIGQIIRHDIDGDLLSNPSSNSEFAEGGLQTLRLGDAAPHFDLARPDDPSTLDVNEQNVADDAIRELAKSLRAQGVE